MIGFMFFLSTSLCLVTSEPRPHQLSKDYLEQVTDANEGG